ncbi:MAG: IS256 family transposase [Bacteroidetes bacterium]|nr:IS256 family transposase [Bacteroidota bacterium]
MEKDNIDLPKDFLKQFKNKEEFQNFFQTLFKQGVEEILKAELDEHFGYEKHSPEGHHSGNSRNGFSKKKVKTESVGDMILNIPRDRKSTFKPQLSPKHERMSDTIEQAIIGMYSRGMTTRDIEEQVREMYGIDVREGTISNVTNRLIDNIKQWQIRPLELVYFVVWMDGISLKIRSNGNIINKTIFLVIGLNNQGMKEVLGMWINETESASFWLNVLTDLKARGVEDILIACTDNLKGFTDAIRSIFPKTITQLCVVHQIRNSARYVVWKDKKEFMIDLKAVYDAPNREAAADALNALESKWGKKYGYVVQSWRNNWDDLTHYFDFPHEVRRIIYTTNVIESLNSGIRKYTLLKNIFPDDSAALKAVYLAINNLEKKWVHTVRNWGAILNQFIIIFEDRCQH